MASSLQIKELPRGQSEIEKRYKDLQLQLPGRLLSINQDFAKLRPSLRKNKKVQDYHRFELHVAEFSCNHFDHGRESVKGLEKMFKETWGGFWKVKSPLCEDSTIVRKYVSAIADMIGLFWAGKEPEKAVHVFINVLKLLAEPELKCEVWINIWMVVFNPKWMDLVLIYYVIEQVNGQRLKKILHWLEKVEEQSSYVLPVMKAENNFVAEADNLDSFLLLKIEILKLLGRKDEAQDAQLKCFILVRCQWLRNKDDLKVWKTMAKIAYNMKRTQLLKWCIDNWHDVDNLPEKLQFHLLLAEEYAKEEKYQKAVQQIFHYTSIVVPKVMKTANNKLDEITDYLSNAIELIKVLQLCNEKIEIQPLEEFYQILEKIRSIRRTVTKLNMGYLRLHCFWADIILLCHIFRDLSQPHCFIAELYYASECLYYAANQGHFRLDQADDALKIAFKINGSSWPLTIDKEVTEEFEERLNYSRAGGFYFVEMLEESIFYIQKDLELNHITSPAQRYRWMGMIGKYNMAILNYKAAQEIYCQALEIKKKYDVEHHPNWEFDIPEDLREISVHSNSEIPEKYYAYIKNDLDKVKFGYSERDLIVDMVKLARYDIVTQRKKSVKKSLEMALNADCMPTGSPIYAETLILLIPVCKKGRERNVYLKQLKDSFKTTASMIVKIHSVFFQHTTNDCIISSFMNCITKEHVFKEEKQNLRLFRGSVFLNKLLKNKRRILPT